MGRNEDRTRVFSWYSLVGSLCSAMGGLTCGILLTLLMDPQGPWHLDRLQAYRVVRLEGYGEGAQKGSCAREGKRKEAACDGTWRMEGWQAQSCVLWVVGVR
jgi:hypothetical protein